jgi:gamma-glutamyltranspeptidase / glutathione hydrolase
MTREELVRRGHERVPGSGAESVTVPGALAGLGGAPGALRYTLSLAEALEPTIRARRGGLPGDPDHRRAVGGAVEKLKADPGPTATYLMDGGPERPRAGEWYRNPDLARTLREVAREGPAPLRRRARPPGRRRRPRELGGFLTPDDMRDGVPWSG